MAKMSGSILVLGCSMLRLLQNWSYIQSKNFTLGEKKIILIVNAETE